MKKTYKIIISAVIVFCVAAGVVVWLVGRGGGETAGTSLAAKQEVIDTAGAAKKSEKQASDKPAVSDKAAEAKDAEKPGPVAPGNQPASAGGAGAGGVGAPVGGPGGVPSVAPGGVGAPATTDGTGGKTEPGKANEPKMETLNIKEVEVKDILPKLAEWTGKVIIPHDDALRQRITIFAPDKMPREKALMLIYSALQSKGFIVEQTDQAIYLKPIKQARTSLIPTLTAEEPLAQLADKTQIVQKIFKLTNYGPTDMQQIVLPMVGDYGYVTADENTNTLVVIETVANLLRIENIIRQMDVPEAERAVTRIFEIQHGDPAEIVQMLKLLLGVERKGGAKPRGAEGMPSPPSESKDGPRGRGGEMPPSGPGGPGGAPASAASTAVGSSPGGMVLIPEPQRKWIIVRASAEVVHQIENWLARLDQPRSEESNYEIIQIRYADVNELAERLNDALQKMPWTEVKSALMVQPLSQAKQIMLVGSAAKRDMVKKLVAEIDVPSDKFETRVFDLKHADPDQIKANIEDLFQESTVRASFIYRYVSSGVTTDMVRVVAFPTLKQVTVVASPENMVKVAAQITKWDVPINIDDVKPLIVELKNSDPIKMAEILTNLFTEKVASQSRPWWWDDAEPKKKAKIVGALYGKLSFQAMPETRKIIVVSQVPEAYAVVEQIIKDLDRQIGAELPVVVSLKYADPEDLCERLNALLNETGTLATVHLSKRELSSYASGSTMDQSDNTNANNNNNAANNQAQSLTTEYKPWWTTMVARSGINQERPISNVIGKIRFIPDHRSKAIMVLTPAEYVESVRQMITELDRPAKQVIVKAIILAVDHEKMTTLGFRYSSNPNAFGNLSDGAVNAITKLQYGESFGALKLESTLDVNVLLDLLVKNTDAQILNQPTVWAKDNEEATFFNGGTIPFITESKSSPESTSFTQSYKQNNVGLTLRVRPNITPEKAVDLTVNLILSQLEPELILNNTATQETNTTTHPIVKDGQTIMLSGILFQSDTKVVKKLPLLGDLPLLGGLFRHNDLQKINKELLIFITPQVVDDTTRPEVLDEMQSSVEKMERITSQLDAAVTEKPENGKKDDGEE